MERYRETSQYHKSQLMWLVLALVALMVWLAYETSVYSSGHIRYSGFAYIIFFLCILIWRYGFRYTYILTDTQFIVITAGLGIVRTYTVDLSDTESFSNRYVKGFFKKTNISHYIHRYSSGDATTMRLFSFSKNGKTHAILFKASDRFMLELQAMMPQQYLDMEIKK